MQSGSLDDVRQLLTSHEGAEDVNWHPRFCVQGQPYITRICTDCDTPLMAAVRREDIAMMRLLIAHGANVAEEIHGDFDGICFLTCKTALLVALYTENEEVITELVTSGADVNQSLGRVGTVVHRCFDHNLNAPILAQFGADPNLTDDFGNTVVSLIIFRCHDLHGDSKWSSAYESLRALLPATRDLNTIVQKNRKLVPGSLTPHMDIQCVTLFLQHGARINYCQMYMTGSPEWASELQKYRKQHRERFI